MTKYSEVCCFILRSYPGFAGGVYCVDKPTPAHRSYRLATAQGSGKCYKFSLKWSKHSRKTGWWLIYPLILPGCVCATYRCIFKVIASLFTYHDAYLCTDIDKGYETTLKTEKSAQRAVATCWSQFVFRAHNVRIPSWLCSKRKLCI